MARNISDREWGILQQLRSTLSEYFAEDRGSRRRALQNLGYDETSIDKMFKRGNISIVFLAQILEELGLTFEDLVSDAFQLGPPRGKPKIRRRLAAERANEAGDDEFDDDSYYDEILSAVKRRERELEDERREAARKALDPGPEEDR